MSMHAHGGDQASSQIERELHRRLYRFDCPEAHTLGEYHADMLPAEQRMSVAAHLVSCDECRAELQSLRAYLAAPTSVPESLASRARRVVATLFQPPPGLAVSGLRGAAQGSTRVFEAGDVTVTVAPGPSRGSLVGLVVMPARAPAALAGRAVRFSAHDGPGAETTLDEMGNFEVDALRPGLYALEIDLPDGSVVVLEGLRVD